MLGTCRRVSLCTSTSNFALENGDAHFILSQKKVSKGSHKADSDFADRCQSYRCETGSHPKCHGLPKSKALCQRLFFQELAKGGLLGFAEHLDPRRRH